MNTSSIFWYFTLSTVLMCMLGLLWIRPGILPPSSPHNTFAHISDVQADLYNTQNILDAELIIRYAHMQTGKNIVAEGIKIRIQDHFKTVLTAESAFIPPQQAITFYTAKLQRHEKKCHVTITTPTIFYNIKDRLFYTDKPVNVNHGATHIHMMGITIPLYTNHIYFGTDLKGTIDPEDTCGLDSSI